MAERQRCPQCGTENDPAQRYCGSCGAQLALICPVCGEISPLGFKFCGKCGTEFKLGSFPETAGEERRVVTVLFADLVGFTARAEQLDPEDVRALLTSYYTRLRTEIESFGGTVEKFIGDAVMAVFGAPVAHGDDPERAVRAALAIQDAVGQMNDADSDLDLQVRIAVNTGEALVSLGAKTNEGEALVAGDVVNTAARLQASAAPGSIVVGEETRRSTKSTIEYRAVDPVVVKGKRDPVPAWVPLSAPGSPGERTAKRVPMLGRQHELALLHGMWERTMGEGRPHLVTIFGPAGIGKTRLASEFGELAAGEGARVIRGRSVPYGGSTAYGAFAQHVKQCAGMFDSDPVPVAYEKLEQAVARLGLAGGNETANHLAILIGLGVDGAAADRQTLFFSARQLVEVMAREQPTILVFEDIHWADSGMLDLLEMLASRIHDVPLLLLTLARPDLLSARPGWGGGLPAYTALPLEPLREEDARDLAAWLLAEAGEDGARYAANFAEAAEGNPLFIEELAASVVERATQPTGELPTSIRSIISARLDVLPAAERATLLDASVVGKIFWRGALATMDPDGDALAERLDSLEGRDLIRREPVSRIQGDQQFSFKHVLIRDVAYATLPRPKRRERHAAVARYLEEATAEIAQTAEALAYHWREAGDNERAVRYLLAAAEHAGRGWAKDHAVALYKEALALVPESDRERRLEVVRKQAVAIQTMWHVPDAESLARQAGSSPPAPEKT
jgi:class 3 adenylate cyclase